MCISEFVGDPLGILLQIAHGKVCQEKFDTYLKRGKEEQFSHVVVVTQIEVIISHKDRKSIGRCCLMSVFEKNFKLVKDRRRNRCSSQS